MRDAEHAADAGANGRNHHDAAEDQLDVEAGIFRRLAVSADHVNVAAEAGVGQNEMAASSIRAATITIQGMPPIDVDPSVVTSGGTL